ncbi:Ribonuclease III [Staphylococcus aureus]|uniref:Ribonuclease III n=1 Tax=Staphylococcus aureus TaxID=1280 RepID=A0A380EJ29_STAAU|nr:Ribonuclease III [Staphylococcus aureus]
MSKQKKSEIVNRFRKRFDTKMTELGFTYQNIDLYQQAFSHSSFINDFNMNRLDHNERLEFLGDAVLELTVHDIYLINIPTCQKGIYKNACHYCM